RGSVYYNKGQMDKAIADYTKAAEIAPGFAEAFNNRGAAYIAVGETEKACSDFTIAAQIGHYDAKENLTKFCTE
ncbi:MAG TPA: tetratricopeptide repeat protein, partial [Bacteroidales bacterium]|nr:tetratricopeptide repeat protein [Bacteroidales bacterium]